MLLTCKPYVRSVTLCVVCALSAMSAVAAPPDAGLYTSYSLSSGYTGISFSVCGSVPGSGGCYGSGSLGPFGHVGAMIEGDAQTGGNVVGRATYVVDIGAGASVVTFGANAGGGGGVLDFGPSGDLQEDGGGASFTLPSRQGISTKDVPTFIPGEGPSS